MTRRETRFVPAALEDDDDGADDDDVAMWEHPLISTGKFLNKKKQTSLAWFSDSKGAARVRRVMPASNITWRQIEKV